MFVDIDIDVDMNIDVDVDMWLNCRIQLNSWYDDMRFPSQSCRTHWLDSNAARAVVDHTSRKN